MRFAFILITAYDDYSVIWVDKEIGKKRERDVGVMKL